MPPTLITLEDFPFEVLMLIFHYVNIESGTNTLQLLNTRLKIIVEQNSSYLLQDFCDFYGINTRLLNLYYDHHGDSEYLAGPNSQLQQLLCLSSELKTTIILSTDLDRQQPSISVGPSVQNSESALSFLLFSTFTKALRSSLEEPVTTADVLAPSSTIDDAIPVQLSTTFNHFLYDKITLHELESIIIAINICATRLWTSVFLYKSSHAKLNSFASLSGYSFNTQQAILTEHVIWRGPQWVSRLLQPSKRSPSVVASQHELEFHHLLNQEGPWQGSREIGARLAANGIARLLWKERQRKLESKINFNAVTEMGVNPVVWRGPAGDM